MKSKKLKRTKKLTNFFDLKEDGISQSSLKTFMSCRRKWMLGLSGLSSPHTQKNTHFGTIVHELLDYVYSSFSGLTIEQIPDFCEEKLTEYLKENADGISITSEQNELEKAMALAIVPEFFRFFHKDKKNFKELSPEYEFAHPFYDVTLRGKVDGIVKIGEDFWQMEHKTKSRIDEDSLLKALRFDYQNLMYSLVLDQQIPQGIKGVLYNVIRKPGIRQGKKESAVEFIERLKADIISRPDWYFMRYEIVYSVKDKENFRSQLKGALNELKLFIQGELPDLQNPASCIYPFKCQFLDVCSSGSTEGLSMREELHPELENDSKVKLEILEYYGLKAPRKRK